MSQLFGSGEIMVFDPDCCYRACTDCPVWNRTKKVGEDEE